MALTTQEKIGLMANQMRDAAASMAANLTNDSWPKKARTVLNVLAFLVNPDDVAATLGEDKIWRIEFQQDRLLKLIELLEKAGRGPTQAEEEYFLDCCQRISMILR